MHLQESLSEIMYVAASSTPSFYYFYFSHCSNLLFIRSVFVWHVPLQCGCYIFSQTIGTSTA